jgi:hypothetical protein
MRLDVYIEDRIYPVEVSDETLQSGGDFFDRMDRDMDAGWKMGPVFVEQPDRYQRAQIVAGRLSLAIERDNPGMVQAMAGYILSRLPEVSRIHVDTSGEPLNTELFHADGSPVA